MRTLSYSEARAFINDGDLISVFKAKSLFNHMTKAFTGEYVHVGGALWLDGGLWVTELNGGGIHAIPLSQLRSSGFDVSEPPKGVTPESARVATQEALRDPEPYGFLTAVATGFVEFFSIPITINWRNNRHCAGRMVRIYDRAGWAEADGQTHTYVISPTKLTKLMKFKFRVMPE